MEEIIFALSDGNPGAIRVLTELMHITHGPMMLLMCDTKRLYGSRICELYSRVCGEDIERFRYHLTIELPNQETGRVSITGPYSTRFGYDSPEDKLFWASRKNGNPNNLWALANPPSPGYRYPLNADGTEPTA